MRSVYTKILLWCFATLVLSMAAMVMVSQFVFTQMVSKGSFFDRINVLLLEQAQKAYESNGPQALAAHLSRADKVLGGEHHLVDRSGRDLATGEDQSALLRQFRFEKGAIQDMIDGRVAAGVASDDGRYRLLVLASNPYRLSSYLPYYVPIFIAVALLCWALAARIASPLRDLARTVDRFGRGDLSVRANSQRRDEIGELGRTFDRMAERIESLLTSERRLLQDISHELRTPLARMSFAAELVLTADDRAAAVARLKKQIRRLSDLVGQLLEATQSRRRSISSCQGEPQARQDRQRRGGRLQPRSRRPRIANRASEQDCSRNRGRRRTDPPGHREHREKCGSLHARGRHRRCLAERDSGHRQNLCAG